MNPVADRIRAVEQALQPRTQIAGQEVRWDLSERMAAYGVPGVSIAVMNHGQVEWAQGYGLCEAGDPTRPVTADSLFQAASMSKPICATLALQLVGEGALDLDAPVTAGLKSWSLADNDLSRCSPVTLRRLLSHTAGLNIHGFDGFNRGDALPTVHEILEGRPPAKNAALAIEREPGTSSQYSGGGTTLAQLMVMDQCDDDFASIAERRIFEPLGMTRSTFAQPLPEARHGEVACGHAPDGTMLEGGWSNLPQLGAGGLWTTPTEYAVFLLALQRAWAGQADALLTRQLAQAMMSRQEAGAFGLGPSLQGLGGNRRFEHGGSQRGYQCESFCFLNDGKGAVVMTNGEAGGSLAFEILNAIAEVYGWRGYLRAPQTPMPTTPEFLDRYVGDYRIVWGLEAPSLSIRRHGDALFTVMAQTPDTPMFLSSPTRSFSPATPFDGVIELDSNGVPQRLRVFEGDIEVVEAVRDNGGSDGPSNPTTKGEIQ